MGHGKETPRQKMIGMMYLVLTALLALNVSAEVLNAFTLVDTSLTQTAENFSKKSETVYTKLAKAATETPDKAKPLHDKAQIIKAKSQELYDALDELKLVIVNKADKPGNLYAQTRDPMDIAAKADNNIPGEVMILNKEGEKLKEKINTYRDFLISNIAEKDRERYKNVIDGLNSTLNTDDIKNSEGRMIAWESSNFDHLPLAGAVTMLSKIMSDVRNAEGDILTLLAASIDADAFKFNKIEAIVKANSSYVLMGEPYKAEVFIAASDSTIAPTIEVGGNNLKVDGGKGIYTGSTGSVGMKTWSGVIKLEHPATKEILTFPFKEQYEVGQSSLVVSPTKMNVFYIGPKNPVEVSVSGVPKEKISVSISNGKITPTSQGYDVVVKSGSKAIIKVSATIDGAVRSMGSREFRVKTVPDPKAVVMIGKNPASGVMAKNVLANGEVKAILENFDFDLSFRVKGFTLSATVGGYVQEAASNSGRLSSAQIALIKKMPSKSKIYFEGIQALGPDGKVRDLGNISFRIK